MFKHRLRLFWSEYLILLFTAVYLVAELLNNDVLALIARALVFPIIMYLYLMKSRVKNRFLTGFILTFGLSELLGLLALTEFNFSFDFTYFVGNSLYIIGYILLIVFVFSQVKIKRIIKKLPFQLIILIGFSIYAFITLNNMLIFEQDDPSFLLQYFLETFYNLLLVILFSISFLNYLVNDTKPRLLLFGACIVLVFSEIIVLGYLYVNQGHILDVSQSVTYALSFYLIYKYFMMKTPTEEVLKNDELSKY